MYDLLRFAAATTIGLLATTLAAGAQSSPAPMMTPQPMMTPVPMMTPAQVLSPAPAMSPAMSPSPSPSPSNPPENALVTARVRSEFLAWQRGRINRSTYSPQAGGTNIDPLIALISPDLAAIGAPQAVTYRTASLLLGDLVYRYEVTGATGTISVLYALDQNGKTDSIVFTPLIFRSATATP